MTVTVTLAQPGNKIGPGLTTGVVTNFLGTIPVGSIWRVTVGLLPEASPIAMVWTRTWAVSADSFTWAIPPFTDDETIFHATVPAPSSTVRVNAEIVSPTSVVIDSGATDATWEPTAGLGNEIQAWGTSSTGGLTPEQDQILHDTNQAVIQQIPAQNATHWAIDLGQFVTHPPVWFLDQLLTPLLLTGRGTLEIPQNPFLFNTYGLIPHFVNVPPAAGRRDGAIVRYNNRVVQFVAMNTTVQDTTRRYIGDFVEFDHDEQPWLWAQYQPVELLYDVTPGFGIGITWLFAGGSPPPGWPP